MPKPGRGADASQNTNKSAAQLRREEEERRRREREAQEAAAKTAAQKRDELRAAQGLPPSVVINGPLATPSTGTTPQTNAAAEEKARQDLIERIQNSGNASFTPKGATAANKAQAKIVNDINKTKKNADLTTAAAKKEQIAAKKKEKEQNKKDKYSGPAPKWAALSGLEYDETGKMTPESKAEYIARRHNAPTAGAGLEGDWASMTDDERRKRLAGRTQTVDAFGNLRYDDIFIIHGRAVTVDDLIKQGYSEDVIQQLVNATRPQKYANDPVHNAANALNPERFVDAANAYLAGHPEAAVEALPTQLAEYEARIRSGSFDSKEEQASYTKEYQRKYDQYMQALLASGGEYTSSVLSTAEKELADLKQGYDLIYANGDNEQIKKLGDIQQHINQLSHRVEDLRRVKNAIDAKEAVDKVQQNGDEALMKSLDNARSLVVNDRLVPIYDKEETFTGIDIEDYEHVSRADQLEKEVKAKGYTDAEIAAYSNYLRKKDYDNLFGPYLKWLNEKTPAGNPAHPIAGPLAAGAVEVATAPMHGIARLLTGAAGAEYGGTYADPGKLLTDVAKEGTEAAARNIEEYYGGKAGFVLSHVFQYSVSAAESFVMGATMGPATSVIMGLNATADAYDDALSRGMSQTQAVALGITSGIFEALFEYLSLDKIKLFNSTKLKGFVGRAVMLLKSSGVEASEEVFTDIANEIADLFIGGELSNFNEAMARGVTPAEYAAQFGLQLVDSAAGGAFGGAAFGMASAVTQHGLSGISTPYNDFQTGKSIQQQGDVSEVISAAKASENKRTQRLGTKLEEQLKDGKNARHLTGQVYNRIQNETVYAEAKQRAMELAKEQGVTLTEREADAIATAAQETRQNARKTADGRIVYTLSPGGETTAVQEGIGKQVIEELTNSRKSAEWVEQTRKKAADFARASGAYLDEIGHAQQVEKGIRQRTAETNRALREGNGASLVTKGVEGVFKNEGEGKDAGVTLYGIAGVTENNGITVVVDSDGKDGVQATATFDLRQNAPAGTVKAADEQTNELLLHLNGALTGQLTQTVTENYGARYNPDLDTRLSLPAANNAIAMYEPAINKSASAYVAWVYDAYKAASRGMAWQSYLDLYQHGKTEEWGRYLTQAQLREAFRAGQAQFAPKAGVTRIGTELLSDKVLTRLAALDEALKNRGFSVIVVDRMEDVNGYVSDRADVAVVSLDSEEGLFETAAFHEAYHLVKRELGEPAGRQFISAVLTEYRKAVGNEQFEKDMDAFAKKYAGDTVGLDSEDARWKVYEEMAAQYFGVVATEHMDGLVSRLEEAGGKTLWTKVREALQQFLDDIRAALNRLAGRDPATAAALRTEEASAAHVLELFDEAVKQTEEIRKARLAEQGERIRSEAESATFEKKSGEISKQFSKRSEVLALKNVDWMDGQGIREQLVKHKDEISKLNPVAIVNYGGEIKTTLKNLIMDQVKKVGGERFVRNGVSFNFDEKGANSIVLHATTDELRAAAIAAPFVAKRGLLISGHQKHDGQNNTTLTYAAPVIINKRKTHVGVVIQFTNDGRAHAVNVEFLENDAKTQKKRSASGLRSRSSKSEVTGLLTNADLIAHGITPLEKSQEEKSDTRNSYKIANDSEYDGEKKTYSRKTGNAIEQKAIAHFGTTDNFKTAGYLLQDGQLLDFSGAHWLDGYDEAYIKNWKEKNDIRQVDHEDIFEAYELAGSDFPSDSGLDFMRRGNIRIVPESPGIELSSVTEPTAEQYRTLKEYIRTVAADGKNFNSQRFSVDITETRKHKAGTLHYTGRINADRIVNDIKHFYATGEVREQSNVERFMYSRRTEDVKEKFDEAVAGRDELGQMLEETQGLIRQAAETLSRAQYDAWIQTVQTDGKVPMLKNVEKIVKKYNDEKLTGVSNETFARQIVNRFVELKDYDYTADALVGDLWGLMFDKANAQTETVENETRDMIRERTKGGRFFIEDGAFRELAEMAGGRGKLNRVFKRVYGFMLTPQSEAEGKGVSTGFGKAADELLADNPNVFNGSFYETLATQGDPFSAAAALFELQDAMTAQTATAEEVYGAETLYEEAMREAAEMADELIRLTPIRTMADAYEGKMNELREAAKGQQLAREKEIAELTERFYGIADSVNRAEALNREASETARRKEAQIRQLENRLSETRYRLKQAEDAGQDTADQLNRTVELLREQIAGLKKDVKAEREKVTRRDVALIDARADRDARLAAQKQYYIEKRHEAVEKRHDNATKQRLRKQIAGKVLWLNGRFTRPTDQQHIPEQLRKAVAPFIEAFARNEKESYEPHIFKWGQIDYLLTFYERLNADSDRNEGTDAENSLLYGKYDSDVADMLRALKETIDGKKITELTTPELYMLDNIMANLRKMVADANTVFLEGRNFNFTQSATTFMQETAKKAKTPNALVRKIKQGADGVNINMAKPIYLFKEIVGGEISKYFDEIREAQNRWAFMVRDSAEVMQKIKDKYHYRDWSGKKNNVTITLTDGHTAVLTKDAALQIYATYKREMAQIVPSAHLTEGGIVLSEELNKEQTKKELQKAKKAGQQAFDAKMDDSMHLIDSKAHHMTVDDLRALEETLTEEQKKYADAVVKYLSDTVSEWGNRTSMELYGYKKFNERYYFPFQSSALYLHQSIGVSDDARIKNKGFTKALTKGANTPIVITGFSEVAAKHIGEMASYSALAAPLENMNRLLQFKINRNQSVKAELQNTYGSGVYQYMHEFLTQLNGGVRRDTTTGFMNKLTGKFKRASVALNFSVMVQQPSAVARAMAMVNPQYFVRSTANWFDYKELKKWSGVAVIKSFGGFDTDVGRSTTSYILGESTLSERIGAFTGWGAEKMDAITWSHIWNAVKRETAHEMKIEYHRKGMSDEFYRRAAARFNEVADYTQVYDSTLSRSQWMRSQDTGVKMATAFMAEPTTTYNMLMFSGMKKNGKAINKGAALGAFVANVIFNTALQSLIGAWRDKKDESYWERYFRHLLQGLTGTRENLFTDSEFNLLNMIPYVKDIISLFQGYDVERSDMSAISDLLKALEKLRKAYADKEDDQSMLDFLKESHELLENAVVTITNFTGLPFKSIYKDFWQGGKNAYEHAKAGGYHTTAQHIANIWKQTFEGEWDKNELLYYAVVQGDKELLARMTKVTQADIDQYINEANDALAAEAHAVSLKTKQLHTKIAQALVQMDTRIENAARAAYAGNLDEARRLAEAVTADGFDANDVFHAIQLIGKELFPNDKTYVDKVTPYQLVTKDMVELAYFDGDAQVVKTLRDARIEQGTSADTVNDNIGDLIDDDYASGEITLAEAQKAYADMTTFNEKKIRDRLTKAAAAMKGNDGTLTYDAMKTVYQEIGVAEDKVGGEIGKLVVADYEAGKFAGKDAAIAEYMKQTGETDRETASLKFDYIDEKTKNEDYPLEFSQYRGYITSGLTGTGVTADVYAKFLDETKNIDGDTTSPGWEAYAARNSGVKSTKKYTQKQWHYVDAIDRIFSTAAQKDAAYRAVADKEGWKLTKLQYAPWN